MLVRMRSLTFRLPLLSGFHFHQLDVIGLRVRRDARCLDGGQSENLAHRFVRCDAKVNIDSVGLSSCDDAFAMLHIRLEGKRGDLLGLEQDAPEEVGDVVVLFFGRKVAPGENGANERDDNGPKGDPKGLTVDLEESVNSRWNGVNSR